jgi:RES domain-containing protein
MDLTHLAAEARKLPPLEFTGSVYRQTDPNRGPFDVQRAATYEARWHRKGQSAPIYAASSELVAMLELARHTDMTAAGGPPLPQRLLSELQIDRLSYIDYSNEVAWSLLGLNRDDLVGDDFTIPQLLADVSRKRADVNGFLAPSAAQRGATTFVIFPEAIAAHVRILSMQLVELRIVRSPAPGHPSP